MSAIVGGCLVFTGSVGILNEVPEIVRNVDRGTNAGTGMQKIMQLAANVLKVIGKFALAIGAIAVGATLFSAPASMAIGVMIQEAINLSIPYIGVGAGGIIGSRVMEIIIGR